MSTSAPTEGESYRGLLTASYVMAPLLAAGVGGILSGLEVDESLAAAWPRFRHTARPEFLQTLPHVHGTSGFFLARLRVP